MKLERTNSTHPDFVQLVAELDAFLTVKDGDMHDYYDQFNSIENLNHVIVLYEDDQAAACGAMKPFDKDSVEIKRMYTLPSQRGKGFGRKVLQELEVWAQELGYTHLILETGASFEAAIALYQKYGFSPIPNYGQYIGVETSRCFKKPI
ncbi:GNAT family N-acetyltransferase [Aureisphaera galaxeae]|uniref:GNAT family N-acetyltransferase n=1 Tax=Aureisphaera galaxeae TaxID=1538023 RepID=UPI00235011D4|nr:GNAT family N-acetyltransferase [Aureisphaera galaxeae]MDC8005391.1 GNAT family N-acetyltransferase [Aureisphaera galaxeae]